MKKSTPTPRQADARRRQRLFGFNLRDWLGRRELDAAENRRSTYDYGTPGAGASRVPERFRVEKPAPTWIHQHGGHPRTPYRNPARIARLAKNGRLRAELRAGQP